MPPTFVWPRFGSVRGPGFWVDPRNWVASRKKLRRDHTVEWRRRYEAEYPSAPARSVPFEKLTNRDAGTGFSFIILGDTGEGDRSQYGLLPLIRTLAPDFLIINGDLAYPAGREQDFIEGFFAPYQNLQVPVWATPGNHEVPTRSTTAVSSSICSARAGTRSCGRTTGSAWCRSPERTGSSRRQGVPWSCSDSTRA